MLDNATHATPNAAAQTAAVRIAGDRLVAELENIGQRYLSRGPLPEPIDPLTPEALIAGLAWSP